MSCKPKIIDSKSKAKVRVAMAAFVFLSLTACVSLQSVSLTPVPAKRENKVSASTHKWIILGFNFDNDFVDRVSEQLKDKCDNGQIRGILTKDEVTSYLLVFKRTVTATGYCQKA
jgi:hypothetical protein